MQGSITLSNAEIATIVAKELDEDKVEFVMNGMETEGDVFTQYQIRIEDAELVKAVKNYLQEVFPNMAIGDVTFAQKQNDANIFSF